MTFTNMTSRMTGVFYPHIPCILENKRKETTYQPKGGFLVLQPTFSFLPSHSFEIKTITMEDGYRGGSGREERGDILRKK